MSAEPMSAAEVLAGLLEIEERMIRAEAFVTAIELRRVRVAVAAMAEREAETSRALTASLNVVKRLQAERDALVADRDAARRERDEQAEELERAELELAYLANEMVFEGNSIGWIAMKARNYKDAISRAWDVLRASGSPPDGNTGLSEMITKHCAEMNAREAALVREVEELRADADRYQELRSRMIAADFEWGDPATAVLVFRYEFPVSANLDAMIDAARAEARDD